MTSETSAADTNCRCETCAAPNERVCQAELFRRLDAEDTLSEEAAERARQFGVLVAGLPD